MIGKLEERRSLTTTFKKFGIEIVFRLDVILPHVRLFQDTIGPDFVFMNALPHRAADVQKLLENDDITRMGCPALSPSLNPVEHVWDALGRCLAGRLHSPRNTQELKHTLIEEWELLPQ
ncbi:transposable element Tcb2 transposase [Trichonephila clavipes]|nr:transposable element Tcb2 transposase [Trichonephila clavipes]